MITDYEYERYFYTGSHRKCLLFVEQDCDVTISAGQPPIITKSGGNPLIITNENILKEKFELQENFNSSENWAFGSVEPSVVSIDIREDGSIPIVKDKMFRLYLYFDSDSSTLLYIGTFVFDEDELSDDSKSRSISGYDLVQTIRDIDIIDFYRALFNAHEAPDPEDPEQTIWVPEREKITIKEARDSFFEYLADKEKGEGLPIVQEVTELPNDAFEFAFDVDTEALSGGQFIEDICEINGRYGRFGRTLSTNEATKNYATFKYIRVERYDEAGEVIPNEIRMNGMMKGLFQTVSIGRLRVYNRDSVLLAYYDEGYKKSLSKYNIYDNIFIDNLTKSKTTKTALKAMMANIYDSMRYRRYVPFQAKAPADLCREAGDRITLYSDIDVITEDGDTKVFRTLIFTRKISGIQNMVDTYTAKGDKKLPEFGDYSKSGGYSSTGSPGGKPTDTDTERPDGEYRLGIMSTDDFVKYIHNIGIELLEEPTKVEVTYVRDDNDHHVELKWKDPPDITTYEPHPCEWAGTVVIRKEGEPPKWRWDGVTVIVNSTTRDAYEETAYIDDNIDINKEYYYGIYPYYVAIDDANHPIRHYTFTKIHKLTTYAPLPKPVINGASIDGVNVTINYTIEDWSGGEYTSCMVICKKDSIPLSSSDYTKKVNVSKGTGTAKFIGLDERSTYYFVVYTTDGTGTWATSEPKMVVTEREQATDFSYTGEIQTFTAPRSGIYQIETWGAQGGNAENGDLVARGGYGAYAVGEVLLQEGETLYINVGGQNGYGGGGS